MKQSLLLIFLSISLPILANDITVSGISSGAYMAQQYHTAFSADVSGAGLVAGGPFYCAKGRMLDALNRCMKTSIGKPLKKYSLDVAKALETKGLIDPTLNMKRAKIYALSGSNDQTVSREVSDVNVDVYKSWGVSAKNIIYETKLPVGHAFPTDNFGNACETESKTPFISNCGRDVAGDILNHLLGKLNPKTPHKKSRLFSFDQGASDHSSSMQKNGFAYIPEGCDQDMNCRIHVAFHGCKQTVDHIDSTFITMTGYNDWAEANKLIIFYPQAAKNKLSNPNGCWDWWGYTGQNYHTKNGPQMKLVNELVEALRNGKLQLETANLEIEDTLNR